MKVKVTSKRPKQVKIARWVPYTVRVFWVDGSTNYSRVSIATAEEWTREDTIKAIVKKFQADVRAPGSEIARVKLISVDGVKVNQVIE